VPGVDLSPDGDDARILLEGDHLGLERIGPCRIPVDHAQEPVRVDLVLEHPQEPVERQDQPVRTIRTQLPGIEYGGGGTDHRADELARQLVLAEEAVERGMARNARFDHRRLGPQQHVSDGCAVHGFLPCAGTGHRQHHQDGTRPRHPRRSVAYSPVVAA
jgi:hypothetical protein